MTGNSDGEAASEEGHDPANGDPANGTLVLGPRLGAIARTYGSAPALICGDITVTWVELESWSNRLARAYAELGVGIGDMVTIALPNNPEFVAACCAAWKLGAIPQPVSSRLPEREREAIVELADSRLVVGVEPGELGDRPSVPVGFMPRADLDDGPLESVVSPSWKAPTSGGSTGRPKLIVAGQPGIMQPLAAAMFGMDPGTTQLVGGPLYHNGPFFCAMLGLLMGQRLVILPRFDPVAALEAIERYHVEFAMLVPTMMSRMLRVMEEADRDPNGGYDLSSLNRLWHMAAPCPDWLKRAWIDRVGPDVVWELYGGTEATAVSIIDGNDWLKHPGSVGRAVMGEFAVFDENGDPVAAGQIGDVYQRAVKGADPTYRYVGAEVKQRGDWETIGDMGWMDEDGYLYLADRRTDLILSGGANIYPAEVEGALLEHPSVESCAVVGVPDEDMGQIVHAVVHLVGPTTEDELRAHTEERLARYKVPRTWQFTDEPVRDDAGKVRRSALAQEAAARLTQA